MITLTEITDEPSQSFLLPIVGYADAEMTLTFKDTQSAWFMDLSWGTRKLNGLRVSTGYNILAQYASSFPFGILVSNPNKQDPLTVSAFTTDNVTLSILSEAEVAEVEAYINGI
jgi:hypothetical protein